MASEDISDFRENFCTLEVRDVNGSIEAIKRYVCYDDEVCCKSGCCLTSRLDQFYHTWYYWFALVAILSCIYASRKRCRKSSRRSSRLHTCQFENRFTPYQPTTYPLAGSLDEDRLFEQLFFTVNSGNLGVNVPPSYSSVAIHKDFGYSADDLPPDYGSVLLPEPPPESESRSETQDESKER